MIVIPNTADLEKHHRLVRHIVAVLVRQQPHIGRSAYNHLRSLRLREHADTERIRQVLALVKSLFLVRETVAIRVFENHHAIPLRALLHPTAVIYTLRRPHASLRVHFDVCRILNHRLCRKQRSRQPRRSRERLHIGFRFLQPEASIYRGFVRRSGESSQEKNISDTGEENVRLHSVRVEPVTAHQL